MGKDQPLRRGKDPITIPSFGEKDEKQECTLVSCRNCGTSPRPLGEGGGDPAVAGEPGEEVSGSFSKQGPSGEQMSKYCVMMVAGERSGDLYGAELAAELKTQLDAVDVFGCGGDAMRQAGVQTTVDSHQFAMVGITEIFSGLPRAYRAFQALMAEVDRRRPQLAILIDSPSLNLRLAKRLKRREIPVVYFIGPQIWAWKKWRMRHVRQRVDKMLCIFDFEERIYQRAGVPVEYVGHPLAEMMARRPRLPRLDFFAKAGLDPKTPTVALLPGSREIEVAYNLPTMLDAARRLTVQRGRESLQFVLALASAPDAEHLETKMLASYATGVTVRAVTRATYDALEHSDVAVVASGTATVEAALLQCPMVVVYRVSPVTAFFARFMIDVPFYSMVNLLAGNPIVKELIQQDFTERAVADEVEHLLDHPEKRRKMVEELAVIRSHLDAGGAMRRTAGAIVHFLQEQVTDSRKVGIGTS
jgi:lipid-A-disaccharide synthase